MMNTMMLNAANTLNLGALLAEDVCAPELRNPNTGAIRARGWLARLFGKSR